MHIIAKLEELGWRFVSLPCFSDMRGMLVYCVQLWLSDPCHLRSKIQEVQRSHVQLLSLALHICPLLLFLFRHNTLHDVNNITYMRRYMDLIGLFIAREPSVFIRGGIEDV